MDQDVLNNCIGRRHTAIGEERSLALVKDLGDGIGGGGERGHGKNPRQGNMVEVEHGEATHRKMKEGTRSTGAS
jgi:hypothetical protein